MATCERAPTPQILAQFPAYIMVKSGGWGTWPRLTRKSQCEIFISGLSYVDALITIMMGICIPCVPSPSHTDYICTLYISNKNKVHIIPSS